MSEFINRTKIATLEQSNADLLDEILELKNELATLQDEMAHLKDSDPVPAVPSQNDAEHIKPNSLPEPEEDTTQKQQTFNSDDQLQESLQTMDSLTVTETTAHPPKPQKSSVIIAFLLGSLFTLLTWFAVEYIKNNELYSAMIMQAIDRLIATF